jgi:hypothetical protein
MYSSRRYSVKRHIENIHGGNAFLVSYTDYLVGRKSGFYLPGIPPNYIPKEDNTNKINYMNIWNEEVFRCSIRKCFESNKDRNLMNILNNTLLH